MWQGGGWAARVPAAGGGEALHHAAAQHAHTPRHPRHQGYLQTGDYMYVASCPDNVLNCLNFTK